MGVHGEQSVHTPGVSLCFVRRLREMEAGIKCLPSYARTRRHVQHDTRRSRNPVQPRCRRIHCMLCSHTVHKLQILRKYTREVRFAPTNYHVLPSDGARTRSRREFFLFCGVIAERFESCQVRSEDEKRKKQRSAIAQSRSQHSVEAKATKCVEEYAYFLPVLKPWRRRTDSTNAHVLPLPLVPVTWITDSPETSSC